MKSTFKSLSLALLTVLLSFTAIAADELPFIELIPGRDAPGDLHSYMAYKMMAADESVESAVQTGEFNPVPAGEVGFGRASDSVLIIFDVENMGEKPGQWVVSTGRVAVLAMEFCQFSNGEMRSCFDSIGNPDIGEHLQKFHAHVLDLSLMPGERIQVAIKFQGSNISILYPSIRTPYSHQEMISENLLITSVATTATLVLVIINACLFLLIRNASFGYFVLAELAFVYQSLFLANYPAIFVFYNNFEQSGFFSSLAQIAFGVFSIRFAQVFLQTRANAPRLDLFLRGFLVVSLAILTVVLIQRVIPFATSRNVVFLSVFVSTSASLILPFVGIWAAIRFGTYHVPLMISWLILGGFCFFYTLAAMNVIEGVASVRYWFGAVGFMEAFFITLSLGLDMRRLQSSEIDAQNQLQHELKEKLQLLQTSHTLSRKKNLALTDLADKARLLLSAGHDARNFLGALRFMGASIQSADNLDKAKILGRKVSESTELLNNTLSTIIYSSASGSSQSDLLALEMLEVDKLMGTLMMVHEQSARAKGLTLRCKSTVSYLPTDGTLLTRIVSNLISNAIKYSEVGKVLVTARLRGQSVVFQVYDQGAGISAEALPFLLDPEKERLRLDKQVEGEGAGLEICHSLAARLGGRIRAISMPGKGSRFELELPVVVCPEAGISCTFLPPTMMKERIYEELAEHLVVRAGAAANTEGSIHTRFLNTVEYSLLEREGHLGGSQYHVIVADDRSVEFREQWCEKVDMIIYTPLNESLTLMALARLDEDHTE
jgi:signal transduction histidine kinase